jgi:anaerobic selenocysteine-containing dehydrogenase
MRRITALLALALLVGSTPLLAADQIDTQEEFNKIINEQCVKCHTRDRIDQAIKNGEKVEAILEKMLRFGVKLTERDQNVLGTFWGEPLK